LLGIRFIVGWNEQLLAVADLVSKIRHLSIPELQADGIRTIVGSKDQQIWVFVVIDVWSQLLAVDGNWQTKLPQHTELVSRRFEPDESAAGALITTDAFKF
jgi:hypothetical protein